MEKTIVRTSQAPIPKGPYSQAVKVGGFVFTAGLAGADPETGKMAPGGIGPQTRQTLRNMAAILEAAGTSMDQVVKVNAYLRDLGDFPGFNEVYKEFFDGEGQPARTTVEVASFLGEMLVEIDAIACMPDA